MKAILSALVAVTILAGAASAPASAFDAKNFWQNWTPENQSN